MPTTIQVRHSTAQVLRKIKERYALDSYDSAIRRLFEEAMRPKKSLFGALGRRSRAEILRDLRDEEER